MKNVITANQLKTKGVSLIEKVTSDGGEAVITVRGKNRYVVLTIDEYNRLREIELDAAIQETRKEISEGKYVEESVEDHIKRISDG